MVTPLLCRGGGGAFSPMCTSDSMGSCMAPEFWQTLISIAEVRKRYCSEIESCKSKLIDEILSGCSAWQPGIADEVVTTERSHDLKFDKGTIYIVYFHLSKSKLKLYICDNKLRSCAQFAPRGKCAPGC